MVASLKLNNLKYTDMEKKRGREKREREREMRVFNANAYASTHFEYVTHFVLRLFKPKGEYEEKMKTC